MVKVLGNILWFICGGLLSGLSWVLAGCLWCISIIGIPIGLQCFKFAGLAFFPFGKEVVYGGGAVSLIANIIWLIVSGIPMAVGNAVAGLICCKMCIRDRFTSGTTVSDEDRLLTLSTCSYEYDNARFVLMGILKEIG